MRIGTGWDLHPLVEGRKLLLGGVEIPHHKGEAGHSDGDVLLHALIDALLGAAALGDIGSYFPPSDQQYKGISSSLLLQKALPLLEGFSIVNIDCTIILEEPKLGPHIATIRESLASLLTLEIHQVSVKAKTAEKLLGEVGTGDAIIAQVVVLLEEEPINFWL